MRCACDLIDICLLWKAYPGKRMHSVERGITGQKVIDAKSEKACKMACYWEMSSCVAIDFRTAEPRHDEACYLHYHAYDMQAVDDVKYTHYQYSDECNEYGRVDSGTAHSWKLLR